MNGKFILILFSFYIAISKVGSVATGQERSIIPFLFLGVAFVVVVAIIVLTIIRRKK